MQGGAYKAKSSSIFQCTNIEFYFYFNFITFKIEGAKPEIVLIAFRVLFLKLKRQNYSFVKEALLLSTRKPNGINFSFTTNLFYNLTKSCAILLQTKTIFDSFFT
jgi:hypothetical protein